MGSITFDLFAAGHGAEHNLDEALRGKRPEADAPDWAPILDQRQRFVFSVKKMLDL